MENQAVSNHQELVVPGRYRPVWNFERKFVKSPAANVSVVATLSGPIDVPRMKRALVRLQEMHPMLRSRIVEDADHKAYIHLDHVPEVPLQVIKRASDRQWYDALAKEHKRPFNQGTGPLIRFILLLSDRPKQPSELIVFCQHTICDATALANCIRDLLQLYADPTCPSAPVFPPQTLERMMPQGEAPKGLASGLKRFVMKTMNQKWRKNPFIFTRQDFLDIHKAYWQQKAYRFILMELNRKETAVLTQRCRDNGVTVNSALIVAFVKAYQDIIGPLPKDNLVIPYDLRRRSEHYKNVFCLLISSLELSLSNVIQDDFWCSARALHDEIAKKINQKSVFGIISDMQSLDGSILDTLGLATNASYMPEESPNYEKVRQFLNDKKNLANVFSEKFRDALPDVIMTNLGRMDYPEEYDGIKLDKMFFTPSASETIPLQLAAVGVSGVLTLTINFIDDLYPADDSRMEAYIKIRNKALDYLNLSDSGAKSDRAF